MMPLWKLVGVAVVGAAVAGVIGSGIGSQTSGSRGCSESGWPSRAAGASHGSVRAGASTYHVWHSATGWHLRLDATAHGVLAGAISADRRLAVIHATRVARSALHGTARGFSFWFRGTGVPQEVRFKASCAHRLSFRLGEGRIYLGSGAAPTPSFEVSRPPATGVGGRIIAGPTCPVVTPDCPPARPVRAAVHIETAPSSRGQGRVRLVKSVASDSSGVFAADLAPGYYVLTAQPAASGSVGGAVTVYVAADVVSEVTLAVDTGIR
jgi:hypothetical protein